MIYLRNFVEVYYSDDEPDAYLDRVVENHSPVGDKEAVRRINDPNDRNYYVAQPGRFVSRPAWGAVFEVTGVDFVSDHWSAFEDLVEEEGFYVNFRSTSLQHLRSLTGGYFEVICGLSEKIQEEIFAEFYRRFINLEFSFLQKPYTLQTVHALEVGLIFPHFEPLQKTAKVGSTNFHILVDTKQNPDILPLPVINLFLTSLPRSFIKSLVFKDLHSTRNTLMRVGAPLSAVLKKRKFSVMGYDMTSISDPLMAIEFENNRLQILVSSKVDKYLTKGKLPSVPGRLLFKASSIGYMFPER